MKTTAERRTDWRRGLVRFEFLRRRYALPAGAIAGIDPWRPLRPLAGAPRGVMGLIERRGRIFTVLDLATILDEIHPTDEPVVVRLAEPLDRLALAIPRDFEFSGDEPAADGCAEQPGRPYSLIESEDPPVHLIDLRRLLESVQRRRTGG